MKYKIRHLEIFHFFVKSYFGKEMTVFDCVAPEVDMIAKPSFFFPGCLKERMIVEEFFE